MTIAEAHEFLALKPQLMALLEAARAAQASAEAEMEAAKGAKALAEAAAAAKVEAVEAKIMKIRDTAMASARHELKSELKAEKIRLEELYSRYEAPRDVERKVERLTAQLQRRAEEVEAELKGVRMSHGRLEAQLRGHRAAASTSSKRLDTARVLSRTATMQHGELESARAVAKGAMEAIIELRKLPAVGASRSTTTAAPAAAAGLSTLAFEQCSGYIRVGPAAAVDAAAADAAHPCSRPLMDGGRYRPIILIILRLLVTVCKVPQRNVAAAVDLCYLLHTGLLPLKHNQINATLVAKAFRKLGTIDRAREAAAAATDPYPYSVNSDTGNDGTEREVAALGTWDAARNMPRALALCCAHIAHDQSGRNGADVLDRQLDLAGRKPEKCCGAGGDSTAHAGGTNPNASQREGLRARLVAKGLESGRMLLYGCIRHFKELELKATFEAGWPGAQAENFLFTLRYVIHKDPEFWRGVWCDSGAKTGPVDVYNRCLASMPIPTASKWECMDEACRKFLATFEVNEARRGIGVTMIEEFVTRARELLRGTADEALPNKAGTHGDKSKFDVFAVDLQNVQLMGAIYATLDLAVANSGPFHHWCKQCCPIYGFSNDFKAHLMAVKACEEAEFWVIAEADSKIAFPGVHGFMQRTYNRAHTELMTSTTKEKLSASMTKAIAAGKAKNEEWMLAQYTRAPFLLGVVTDERHRLLTAQLILRALGHGVRLDASLTVAKLASAAPKDAVQRRLAACIERERASGELCAWWERWALGASLDEWLLLAMAPSQDYGNPVLCIERTPTVWKALIPLFVLMVHNTRLESYVSKQKQLQQGHNTTPSMVNAIFMHHAGLEETRALLTSNQMRSTTGSGARHKGALEEASKGHQLTDPMRNKLQRQGLLFLTVTSVLPLYNVKEIYARGSDSAASKERVARDADAANAAAVPERKLVAFQHTHIAGPCRARAPVKPVAAIAHLAPQDGANSQGRGAAAIAARKKTAKAAKAVLPPAAQAGKQPAPNAGQKRKVRAQEVVAHTARLAAPLAQRQAQAQAREAEARAAATRVRDEVEAENAGKKARLEEREQLRVELGVWERRIGRKLKRTDLDRDPELAVKYARYRELH